MRFRSAIIWSGISLFGQSGITLLSTIILARILTPDDFGLVGIVAIFMSLSQIVVDSEMGGALLRKETVNNEDYSTLFLYNLSVSLILYLVFYLCSPFISSFYQRPELTAIIRVISLMIILHAFKVTQIIMILRALQFKFYAVVNLVSGLLSLTLAICVAEKGYGYWALVWQPVSFAAISLLIISCHNRFTPSLSFSRESFRHQFAFGINLLGARTISAISTNISTNIIGKIASLQFTGLYTQANRITTFFTNFSDALIAQSVYPVMAKSNDLKQIKDAYHRILKYLMAATAVLILLITIFAPVIIRIILGEDWMGSVWIFRILALSILPGCTMPLCRNVMKTLGITSRVLKIETILSVIFLAAVIPAAFFGTTPVIWMFVTIQYIGCAIWLIYTEKVLSWNTL